LKACRSRSLHALQMGVNRGIRNGPGPAMDQH